MSFKLSKHGWLVAAVSSAALITACKKNSDRHNVQICSHEVESLSLSLEQQVQEFRNTLYAYERRQANEAQLRKSARNTVKLCEEFRSYIHQESCLSRDHFSGQEVRIQRDMFIDECNEAAAYDNGGWDRNNWDRDNHPGRGEWGHEDRQPRSSWADEPLSRLKSRDIALYIVDSDQVLKALNARRNPKAFLRGQLVSINEARKAAERGETTCAVMTRRDEFRARKPLPVVQIEDRSQRDHQSYTLITEDGLQASCQKSGRDLMTPRDVQGAFGSAIQIKH